MASLVPHPTPIPGLTLLETRPVGDSRGRFGRLFCARELAPLDLPGPIVQVNHSFTRARGAVRGLHYQRPPMAEAKIVRCLKGRVWDVAVDLRRGSPTFLNWHAVELSPEGWNALYLPRGFAHGFQTLEDGCELLYLHTEFYSPEHEGGLRHDDPALSIPWPLAVTELSGRDRSHPPLHPDHGPAFAGLEIA